MNYNKPIFIKTRWDKLFYALFKRSDKSMAMKSCQFCRGCRVPLPNADLLTQNLPFKSEGIGKTGYGARNGVLP